MKVTSRVSKDHHLGTAELHVLLWLVTRSEFLYDEKSEQSMHITTNASISNDFLILFNNREVYLITPIKNTRQAFLRLKCLILSPIKSL